MEIVLILCAYLLGSAPFAILISRAMGLPDPREYGSGNPGASNVARSGNRGAAILTLFADFAKGALSAGAGTHFFGPEIGAAAGAAAVAGHVFPVFLKFKGGKGVATGLGVFGAWDPAFLAAALTAWAATFWIWRISSVSSLSAMATAAVLFSVMGVYWATVYAAVFVAVLVAARHKKNITDLIRGKERKFRKSDQQKRGKSADE